MRSLIALVLIFLMILPLYPVAAPASTPRAGSYPVVYLGGHATWPPESYSRLAMDRSDRDADGISDDLEDARGVVRVIVWFDSRTANQVGQGILLNSLWSAMEYAESLGGRIYAGPWTHALVGFAVEIDASMLRSLAQAYMGMDVDGDGVGDRVLLSRDIEVRGFNLWSAKQMNIRPYSWMGLGATGEGVTIAILDSGIDGGNDAFRGKIVYWRDYTGDSEGVKHDTPYDDNSHGTHVAGTAAGGAGCQGR